MNDICVLICSVAILLLTVIAILDLLEIPRQLKRIANALEKKNGWKDNCDSYLCPHCGFECDNPNRFNYQGKYCPMCSKRVRWDI